MTTYAELDEGEYTRLHRRLLAEKGSAFQRDFLNAVKDADDFLSFMEREVSRIGGGGRRRIPWTSNGAVLQGANNRSGTVDVRHLV